MTEDYLPQFKGVKNKEHNEIRTYEIEVKSRLKLALSLIKNKTDPLPQHHFPILITFPISSFTLKKTIDLLMHRRT